MRVTLSSAKIIIVLVLLIAAHTHLSAQYNADSILRVINDANQPDSARLKALLKHSEYLKDIDLDNAFLYSKQAVALADQSGTPPDRYYARLTLATIYKYRGDFKSSEKFYLEALDGYQALKDSSGIASAYGHLGTLYQAMRRNQMAIQYLLKALQIHSIINSSPYHIAATLNNIGNIYLTEKKHRRALEYYDKASRVNKPNKFTKWLSINYLNMGNCYSELGITDSAEIFFERSLEIARQKSINWVLAANYEGLGDLALVKKEYKVAQQYFITARDYATRAKNPELLVYTLAGHAEALSGLQQHQQAIQEWRAVRDSADKYDFPMAKAELLLLGGKIFAAAGDHEQSSLLYKSYTKLKDSLHAADNELMYADFESRLNQEMMLQVEQHRREQEALQQEAALHQSQLMLYAAVVVIILALIAGLIAYRGYRQKKKSHEEIVYQKSLVDEKNREILDSINYAKRLQSAILPSDQAIQAAFTEAFVLYQPKDIVAGDFYFFEEYGTYKFIAVADCTGHGVPGAMVSVVCANALQRAIQEHQLHEPGKILDKVNDLVESAFSKNAAGVRDGMDISLCVFNTHTNELMWSGANLSLVICANDSLQEIKGNKQPVGKFDERLPFTTHHITPTKGSMLFCYSDGYADQFGGPDAKKLKSKNLKNLLLQKSNLPATQQHEELQQFFTNWKGALEQIDDVCVIGLRM
jgi:serine phosphatase RsbU (regulator of sigma subunit)/Tfp pilus assembly protein PilF